MIWKLYIDPDDSRDNGQTRYRLRRGCRPHMHLRPESRFRDVSFILSVGSLSQTRRTPNRKHRAAYSPARAMAPENPLKQLPQYQRL
jgi:hypothetical protein